MDKLDKQKGVIHLVAIVILALGIIAGVYLVQQISNLKSKATLGGVNLSLQPSQINANPNQEFTLSVFANTQNLNVSAAEIHISFDPNQVEVRDIRAENVLPVVLQTGQISNNEAKITLGVNPSSSFQGSGSIATLTVIPKPNFTSTTIQFTNQTKVAALNRQDNTVGSLNSTSITLSLPSPSPTPQPTPTPTPSPTASPTPQSASPSPVSTRSSPNSIPRAQTLSQSPVPSPISIRTPQPSPQTPSAFQLIQQRRAENIRRLASSPTIEPSPSPQDNEDTVIRVVNRIPVLSGVINFFVNTLEAVFNLWENL